ncbi:unnamed protein product [Nippostrongylus brasiliensis]|uniref:Nucleolin-like n=1 Tax=Nippostrongylus brasiliensis TaxID=27835 RepID=A0A0N4YG86_NIPBR|nr:hypothetical protein Q1695_012321 [Nippostrongylus brasiliensis]VDL79405.1 unnamed protein product [Nippostrongylus brasiliensis]
MDMDEHREDTTPSEVAAADIQSEPAEPKQPQQEVEDQIELEQNDEDLIKIGDADDSNDEDEAEDPPPREDNVQAPANAVQEPRHRIRPAPADITAQLKNLLRNARQVGRDLKLMMRDLKNARHVAPSIQCGASPSRRNHCAVHIL